MQGSPALITSNWRTTVQHQQQPGHEGTLAGSSGEQRGREPGLPRFLPALGCSLIPSLFFSSLSLPPLSTLGSTERFLQAWMCHQAGISQLLLWYTLPCHSLLVGKSGVWCLLPGPVSMYSVSWISSFLSSSHPSMISWGKEPRAQALKWFLLHLGKCVHVCMVTYADGELEVEQKKWG